jgi:hypothetical protein
MSRWPESSKFGKHLDELSFDGEVKSAVTDAI